MIRKAEVHSGRIACDSNADEHHQALIACCLRFLMPIDAGSLQQPQNPLAGMLVRAPSCTAGCNTVGIVLAKLADFQSRACSQRAIQLLLLTLCCLASFAKQLQVQQIHLFWTESSGQHDDAQ